MINRQTFLFLLAAVLISGAAATAAGQPAWVSRGPDDIGVHHGPGRGRRRRLTPGRPAASIARPPSGAGGARRTSPRSSSGRSPPGRARRSMRSCYPTGLFVSRDGGDTWERLAGNDSGLSAIAIDPNEPTTAYLTAYTGALWRTTDSGRTWKRLPATHMSYLVAVRFDPHDTHSSCFGLRRAQSAGPSSQHGRRHDFYPDVDQRVDGLQRGAIGSGEVSGNFYVALDSSVCRTARRRRHLDVHSARAYFFESSRCRPPPRARPRSSSAFDDGVRSAPTAERRGPTPGTARIDGALRPVAVDAASASVLVGTEEGIYRSTDRGASWHRHSGGLRSSVITTLAVDPADSSNVFASRLHEHSGAWPVPLGRRGRRVVPADQRDRYHPASIR